MVAMKEIDETFINIDERFKHIQNQTQFEIRKTAMMGKHLRAV